MKLLDLKVGEIATRKDYEKRIHHKNSESSPLFVKRINETTFGYITLKLPSPTAALSKGSMAFVHSDYYLVSDEQFNEFLKKGKNMIHEHEKVVNNNQLKMQTNISAQSKYMIVSWTTSSKPIYADSEDHAYKIIAHLMENDKTLVYSKFYVFKLDKIIQQPKQEINIDFVKSLVVKPE